MHEHSYLTANGCSDLVTVRHLNVRLEETFMCLGVSAHACAFSLAVEDLCPRYG